MVQNRPVYVEIPDKALEVDTVTALTIFEAIDAKNPGWTAALDLANEKMLQNTFRAYVKTGTLGITLDGTDATAATSESVEAGEHFIENTVLGNVSFIGVGGPCTFVIHVGNL